MSDKMDRIEALWPYVHREGTEVERADVESRLREDGELRATVGQIKNMDRMLRELIPVAEWSDEDLADCILKCWEAETTTEAQERSGEICGGSFGKTLLFRQVARYLCAAAVILVGIAVPLMMLNTDPIRWSEPEIVPLQYRGVTTSAQSTAASKEAGMACLSSLQESVRTGYARLHPGEGRAFAWGGKWNFQMRFKQLPRQAFCIQVTALDGHGHFAREWTEYFADLEDFQSRVDDVSARMLGDLEKAGAAERNVP